MNREDVAARLGKIKVLAAIPDEPEAHEEADRLWADVLRAIAGGTEDPAGLAAEALKVQEIRFGRWYT